MLRTLRLVEEIGGEVPHNLMFSTFLSHLCSMNIRIILVTNTEVGDIHKSSAFRFIVTEWLTITSVGLIYILI